jgi:hypothetical protein
MPLVDGAGATTIDPIKAVIDEARGVRDAKDARIGELDAIRAELEGKITERDSQIANTVAYAQHVLRVGKAELMANQIGFSDPSDAIALLGDLSQFPVDLEAGTVKGIDKALAALAEKKPYLIKAPAAVAAAIPAAIPPTPSESSAKARQAEQESEAISRKDSIRQQASTYF